MPKFKICGKKGLFLKVNSNSICQYCEEQSDTHIKEVKNEIQSVNDYIVSFFENDELLNVCEHFTRKEPCLPIHFLDLVYVPITAPKDFNAFGHYAEVSEYKFEYPENIETENSSYIQILKQYKGNTLFADKSCLLVASVIRQAGIDSPIIFNEKGKTYDYLASEINKIRHLFKMLCNQNIIGTELNLYKYYAFIFIITTYKKMQYVQNADDIITENKLTIDFNKISFDNDKYVNSIIKDLFKQKADKGMISMFIVGLFIKKYFNTPINKIETKLSPIIDSCLKDLKEKEYLDKLCIEEEPSIPKYSIAEIDSMNSCDFEIFIAEIFKKLGYSTENTKLSCDQGVDVIAKKGDNIIAIQAKHYKQPVGNHAIMEVVGGAKFYKASLCYVITNNYFTKSAKELAAANNVILWDRDKLIEKLSEL